MSLAITTASPLTAGSTYAAYNLAFGASGGTAPYTWALASGALPSGLSLSSAGVLSGTPTVAGTFLFSVTVTDSAAATATLSCSLEIATTVFDDMIAGLVEADARLFNMHSSEVLATRTIQRFWPDLMITDPTAALAGLEPYRMFLEQFSSTKNYPTAKRYVDDPLVEGTVMTGRWRSAAVDIKMQGGVPYIVQTLKLGCLETIVKTVNQATVYDFTEARLLNPGMFDVLRPIAIIVWQNISPEKVFEVAAAAPLTCVNPVIFGSSLPAGTWIRKGDVARGSDDGSCFVSVALSLEPESVIVATEAQADATGQRTITRTDTREAARALVAAAVTPTTGKILSGNVQRIGEEGSEAQIQERAAVALTTALSVATTSAFETQAAATDKNVAAAATPPTAPTPPVAVTGAVVTARVEKTEYPGISNKTTEERKAVAATTAMSTATTSALETQAAATDKNVAAAAAAPSAPAAPVPVTGKIVTERTDKTEFPGIVNKTTEERAAVKLSGAVSTTTVARADTSASIMDRNAATGDAVPTAPILPGPTTGKIVTTRIDKTDFPSVENKTVEEKAAVAMTGAVSAGSASALEQSSSMTDKNVLDAATAPVPAAAPSSVTGKIVQTRTDKTDYPGVSNKTVEHKIAVKLADAVKVTVVSASETQASVTDRNAATGDAAPTAPTPPSPTTGKIVTIRTDKTEFPSVENKTVEERAAVAVTSASSVATTSAFETQASATDKNVAAAATAPTAPAAPSPVTGKIVTDRVDKTDYPGVSTKTREERAAVAATTAVSSATTSASETQAAITDRNVDAAATPPTAPTPPVAVSGQIVTARVDKTDYPGIVNKTTEVRAAVALVSQVSTATTSATEKSAAITDKNVLAAATPPTAPTPPAAVDGKVVTERVDKTDYPGVVNKTIEEQVAVKVDSGWVSFPSKYGTAYVRHIENATLAEVVAACLLPTIPAGYVASPSLTPTKFFQRWGLILHATIDGSGGSAPESDWANFNEQDTSGTAHKDLVIDGVSKSIMINWGIIQSTSHATVKAFLVGKGNPHFESVNGGRHFRGTYCTYRGNPVAFVGP